MEAYSVDIILEGENLTACNVTTSSMHGLIWTYGIFMPITCILGIFGNFLTLYVMLTSDKKFNGFIYLYMKGLAIIDIFQIFHTIQVCNTNEQPNGGLLHVNYLK